MIERIEIAGLPDDAPELVLYRALDVEQIGSVYETMMGFRLETAASRSVALSRR